MDRLLTQMDPRNVSASPIRKMLIKKLVKYYDRLTHERSFSPSKSRSRSRQIRESPYNHDPIFKKRGLTQKLEAKLNKQRRRKYYKDEAVLKKKMYELEALMKMELDKAQNEGYDLALPPKTEIYRAVSGFPSFMKLKNRRLKEKSLMRKDTLVAFNEFRQNKPFRTVDTELEDRVVQAYRSPVTPDSEVISADSEIENMKYEKEYGHSKLYHLNVKNRYMHDSKALLDKHDYHKRKSKEIRRLQYVAGIKSRTNRNKDVTPPRGSKHKARVSNRGIKTASTKKKRRRRKRRRSKARKPEPITEEEEQIEDSSKDGAINLNDIPGLSDMDENKEGQHEQLMQDYKDLKRTKLMELAKKLGDPDLPRRDKLKLILELELLLEDELLKMNILNQPLKRSNPDESHPVWVLYDGMTFPALMRSLNGFKINTDDDSLLEVREGDLVAIELNETANTNTKPGEFAKDDLPFAFNGEIRRPGEEEKDCDFIVNTGGDDDSRYKILIFLRKEQPKVEEVEEVSEAPHEESASKANPLPREAPDMEDQPDFKYHEVVLGYEPDQEDQLYEVESGEETPKRAVPVPEDVGVTQEIIPDEDDEVVKVQDEDPQEEIEEILGEPEQQPEEPQEPEEVLDTNCTVFELDGEKIGRAKVTLGDGDENLFYTKAILLNGENQTDFILVKDNGNGTIIIKHADMSKSSEKVIKEEETDLPGQVGVAKVLTLEPENQSSLPRLVYYVDKVGFLGSSKILVGERAKLRGVEQEDLVGIIDPKSNSEALVLRIGEGLGTVYLRIIMDGSEEDIQNDEDLENILNRDDTGEGVSIIHSDLAITKLLMKIQAEIQKKIMERVEQAEEDRLADALDDKTPEPLPLELHAKEEDPEQERKDQERQERLREIQNELVRRQLIEPEQIDDSRHIEDHQDRIRALEELEERRNMALAEREWQEAEAQRIREESEAERRRLQEEARLHQESLDHQRWLSEQEAERLRIEAEKERQRLIEDAERKKMEADERLRLIEEERRIRQQQLDEEREHHEQEVERVKGEFEKEAQRRLEEEDNRKRSFEEKQRQIQEELEKVEEAKKRIQEEQERLEQERLAKEEEEAERRRQAEEERARLEDEKRRQKEAEEQIKKENERLAKELEAFKQKEDARLAQIEEEKLAIEQEKNGLVDELDELRKTQIQMQEEQDKLQNRLQEEKKQVSEEEERLKEREKNLQERLAETYQKLKDLEESRLADEAKIREIEEAKERKLQEEINKREEEEKKRLEAEERNRQLQADFEQKLAEHRRKKEEEEQARQQELERLQREQEEEKKRIEDELRAQLEEEVRKRREIEDQSAKDIEKQKRLEERKRILQEEARERLRKKEVQEKIDEKVKQILEKERNLNKIETLSKGIQMTKPAESVKSIDESMVPPPSVTSKRSRRSKEDRRRQRMLNNGTEPLEIRPITVASKINHADNASSKISLRSGQAYSQNNANPPIKAMTEKVHMYRRPNYHEVRRVEPSPERRVVTPTDRRVYRKQAKPNPQLQQTSATNYYLRTTEKQSESEQRTPAGYRTSNRFSKSPIEIFTGEKRRVIKAVPTGKLIESNDSHYGRLALNLDIDHEKQIEFDGYGSVTIKTSPQKDNETLRAIRKGVYEASKVSYQTTAEPQTARVYRASPVDPQVREASLPRARVYTRSPYTSRSPHRATLVEEGKRRVMDAIKRLEDEKKV